MRNNISNKKSVGQMLPPMWTADFKQHGELATRNPLSVRSVERCKVHHRALSVFRQHRFGNLPQPVMQTQPQHPPILLTRLGVHAVSTQTHKNGRTDGRTDDDHEEEDLLHAVSSDPSRQVPVLGIVLLRRQGIPVGSTLVYTAIPRAELTDDCE
ncbi:hypothetical protein T265_09209 [Opisthorchis viverrini]|uniref:Uncharacterized protein n=1 Tax=Opisthorchis viverrini TaxID=6198 RepID=A0A075A5R8_OPIVI|nr:hypothetical protein T265_09209 [Opisthorchis viverrini]KER22764.1 hypothetical protein T265_09209 [Opisthorchis viverrini]